MCEVANHGESKAKRRYALRMPTEYRKTTLANGLEIHAEIDPTAHTAAVGFFVRTGARDEPSALMGVSHFLEHMMFKGTPTRTAEHVNRDFDDLGANHNAYTTNELTAYYVHAIPSRLLPSLEVLADILRPSLRQADFDEERGVILEEIAMYADQPFSTAYEAMLERLYKGHPLAHRVLGTTETVTNMQRDAMQSYFDARYSSDNTALCAAGKVDFDELVLHAERLCGAWQHGQPKREYPTLESNAGEASITLPNASRHYMILAMPAPGVDDPHRYAAGLLMHILGGGDGSRLHWALIETGIAEEASAGYDGHDGIGEYAICAVCDADRVEEVQSVLTRELQALCASITDDDLERARARIATSAASAGERPSGRMHRLGAFYCYRQEFLTLDAEVERLAAVSHADLHACAAAFPLTPLVQIRVQPQTEAMKATLSTTAS